MKLKTIGFAPKTVAKLALGLASATAILPLQATAGYAQPTGSAAVKQVRTDQPAQRLPTQIEAAPANPRPNIPVGGNGPVYNGNGCPEGTILIMFDMPIYDDEGLFVVGHEPTPMCIDEDTQPAG